ncbi:MAG: DNA helicase RecQ [Bacteroidetes bacterium]|nr:MAG: DNA helicase RecQ [Bacteroidota bacterium]
MHIEKAKAALKKYFGYDRFRPLQAEIIQSVYDGKDGIVLMPTGGGKSLCYQIPAITMPGVCLVVSPLISLMKDQVEALRANGIAAAFLNSSQDYQSQRQVEDDFFNGTLDLLYVSPEKLCSLEFLPLLRKAPVSFFAVDEAHCISAWGHDFRPEYSQLKFLKKEFPDKPILALTATADRLTRLDIGEQLDLRAPQTFLSSFDRPNLNLEVRPGQRRKPQILKFIRERPNQSGIIYCLTRKDTENLCATLLAAGIKAGFYHAALSSEERSRIQEAFIKDEIPVITATVAFGMGIDKSNVRWVIHYNLPKNIESYYQEIGRAGRDGAPADTLLFYSFQDVMLYRRMIEDSDLRDIKLAKLERMYQYATIPACRRKILLNYFSEDRRHNCGNCDVCKNPPEVIDGTILAQKALSALIRLREKVSLGVLVDVLRGSGRSEIFQKGYHQIKTYGAGKDLSWRDWMNYLEQMLNQGLIEIAYEDHNKVRVTPAGRAVLFEGHKVQLVKMEVLKKREDTAKKAAKKVDKKTSIRQRVRDELFDILRQKRLELAREKNVPPYVIFSDVTLEEMAATRPTTPDELQDISGVGEFKLKEYGPVFLKAIREYLANQSPAGFSDKKTSALKTFQLYKQGKNIETIAEIRGLSPKTICGHLIYCFQIGEPVKISDFVSRKEIAAVAKATDGMEPPLKLTPVFDALNGEISYDKIRFALAFLSKQNTAM